MRIQVALPIALIALVLAAPPLARADETDNFTCRARLTRDSLAALDGWVNARIAEAIGHANRRGAAECDAACLRRELQARVGRSVRQVTMVPHSSFVKWIKAQKDIERCHLKFSDTIYGARRYDQPWRFPFTGRIIFVADSIRLSGHVVGIDKIDHFIREGLVHWRTVSEPGGDIAASIAREVGLPRRQFSWTEYGLKGMSLTGVLSYADLAAGYFGYRFWSDLLSMAGPESLVGPDASGAQFVQRRPFTFAAYVNEAWDESINCSTFDPALAGEVAIALRDRSMTCPSGSVQALAALPDARLYVNPAQLGQRDLRHGGVDGWSAEAGRYASMSTRLNELASLLQCPACRASSWTVTGTELAGSLTCTACGAVYTSARGVLDLGEADEDPQVTAERAAVHITESRADLGGIGDAVGDLADAQGELRDALLSLPYGNSSRYFQQPGYFSNVRLSAAGFDFLVEHLGLRPGLRLLDLGADATWSTSQFARRGLDCTAVDINHHLPAGQLFAEHHGTPYHMVRADMRRVPFRPETFDIVVAISALHHNPELNGIAANIARVLRPGGRLAFLEPYCENEEAKRAFGLEQIAAGISEQVYLLQEWHDAFAAVGLEVEAHRVCDSFCAVYRKRADGTAAPAGLDALFRGTYAGRIALASPAEPVVTTGAAWTVPVTIVNASRDVWCSASHFMMRASYHLYRRVDGRDELVAWDNVRTHLPQPLAPGQQVTIPLEITAIDEPGDYIAEVDMLHEFVSWFAERGFSGFRLPFTVVRRPSSWWPFRRG